MTNEVARMNIQKCPDCSGSGLWKPAWAIQMNREYPCATCEGQGCIPATEAPVAPASTVAEELEAARAELREQSAVNADLFRQMEAEAHRADEAIVEMKAMRDEIARLRAGIESIEKWAQSSYVVSSAAHRIIAERIDMLLSRKGKD